MSDVGVLVRTNVRHSLRSQRTMLVLLLVAIATLLVCDSVVGAGVARYARSVRHTSALNLVELGSTGSGADREITDATLAQAAAIPGVTGVYPWYQTDLSLSEPSTWPDPDTNPGALWATPLVPGLFPAVVAGAIPAAGLSGDQIALPHTVPGGTLDGLLGRAVQLDYTEVTGPGQGEPAHRTFRVVAIVDNSTPGAAGETPSYVSEATLRSILAAGGSAGGGPLTYPTGYVRAGSADDVPAVQRALAAQGFAVDSVASQLRSLSGLFAVLSWASRVLAVVLALFCLAVGGSVGAAWVRQRTREIGLLKAIGWSRRRIAAALLTELALVGAAAGVVGAVIGVAASLVVTAVVARQDLEILPIDGWTGPGWATALLAAVLVPVCVGLGGLRNTVRASGLDADDALRDL